MSGWLVVAQGLAVDVVCRSAWYGGSLGGLSSHLVHGTFDTVCSTWGSQLLPLARTRFGRGSEVLAEVRYWSSPLGSQAGTQAA